MRWRYKMHLQDALARHALASGEPERALALTSEEMEDARRYTAPKLEARALELRGRALVAMDRRDEAERDLRGALEVGSRIGYPPVLWRAHSLLSELARRSGDGASVERHAAEARTLVENLAGSLSEAELRREFLAMRESLTSDPLGAYR